MSLIYKINELDDVLKSLDNYTNTNYKDGTLMIDIDRACMTEEKNLAQLYEDNPFLRNKIVASTQKMSFENTDKLISTRANLFDFVDKCKHIFKKVAFITQRTEDEFDKIRKDINKSDIDIINYDTLLKNNTEIIYYIDTTSEAYNKLNKADNSVLFQMFPI